MKMGVVADDITGANDIGSMFAKSGLLAHVYPSDLSGFCVANLTGLSTPDISILDTNSRLDLPQVAYDKVFAATRELQRAGCKQFFNKTCSVFRGNIGREFDAMLDALGQEFALIVLGFPKNGRITLEGIHYVHGRRLEESEFRHDPVHPMTQSNLVEILQSQTPRRVGLIPHPVVGQGSAVLRERIKQLRAEYNYLILDVADQQALGTIAQAVHDYPVLCGSSAIAEELPAVWGVVGRQPPIQLPPDTGLGVLCAAGSLMPQTAAQLQHLRNAGMPMLELNPLRLFNPQERETEIGRLVDELIRVLRTNAGLDVVVHSPNDPGIVEQTRTVGQQQGFSKTETARLVSATLAEVVARSVERSGLNRLVIAGGETSAAVCARLGVTGLRIWKEIQPGLPSCLSLSEPPLFLVLKSGSFGSPDFLRQALSHLKAESEFAN